jgi:peptidoglycan/LPS O-acetylase OafA/YrhL
MRWLGLAAITALYFTKPFSQTYLTTYVALAAVVYIVGSKAKPTTSPAILRIVERFGILSYEIYLFHMVLFWATDFLVHAFHSTFMFGIVNWTVLGVRLWMIYFVSSLIAKHYSDPANASIREFLNRRSAISARCSALKVEMEPDVITSSTAS